MVNNSDHKTLQVANVHEVCCGTLAHQFNSRSCNNQSVSQQLAHYQYHSHRVPDTAGDNAYKSTKKSTTT